MKQHNPTDGRKCWGTARERERLRARYQIRERVSNAEHEDNWAECPLVADALEDSSLVMSQADRDLFSQLIVHLRNGDRSKFSLSLIDRHIHIFSSKIPIKYLQDSMPQMLPLCTAWFGQDYACALEKYIQSLNTFTLMEYAVWIGKISILGSLLIGGVNPCVRSCHRRKKDGDNCSDEMQWWQRRMKQAGSKVLKRFFDCFPLALETHVVKRVVDMRICAHDQQKDEIVTCCLKCKIKRVPLDYKLRFSPCQHTFCEPCFWEDFLLHIDQRGDENDVVLCPICGVAGTTEDGAEDASLQYQQTTDFKDLSPAKRYQESLTRFQSLPINRQALKLKREKKKKLSEKGYIAPSWYEAVVSSVGLTQDVRRDKFFSYIERNAIHYTKACLIAGVDVNWKNEYGQTALYICFWRGFLEIAQLLLNYGANPNATANGGSSIQHICEVFRHDCLIELVKNQNSSAQSLCDNEDDRPVQSFVLPNRQEGEVDFSLTTLIPQTYDHPGAGSSIIDNALSPQQVESLLVLCSCLPLDTTQKKKANSLCSSERAYYCDAEGQICRMLQNVTSKVGLVSNPNAVKVFPHMRFLIYDRAGTILAPHGTWIKTGISLKMPFLIVSEKPFTFNF